MIGKIKECAASEVPDWQKQVRTCVKDPTDWKETEEIIFPGQKASMVINCYSDLEKLEKVKKSARSDSIFILLKWRNNIWNFG